MPIIFKKKSAKKKVDPRLQQTTAEVVKRLRRNMLVHSYLYYELDKPIISDHDWQVKADSLVSVQKRYGVKFGFHDAQFADWDGSTGMHLKFDDWTKKTAARLLEVKK